MSSTRLGYAVVLVGCVAVFGVQSWWHWAFTVDDAYISFRYARNLVEGHGLVFNEGERVEGYSNFLWVLLIAAAMKLGLPVEVTAKSLGILAGAGLIVAGASLAQRLTTGGPAAGLWAAAVIATLPSLAYWSVGGLETSLFALLLSGGLLAWLCANNAPSAAGAGVLLALASMTRPEGPLFLVGSAVARLIRERRACVRAVGWYVGGFLLVAAPWFAWRYWYYGQLLPNTFYVKNPTGWLPVRPGGLLYVESFLRSGPGLVFWGLLPLAVSPRLYLQGRAVEALAPLVVYLVWVARVGDWMPEHRFLVPVVAIWAACSCAALLTLWRRAHAYHARRGRIAGWSCGVAAVLLLGHSAAYSWTNRGEGGAPWAAAVRAAAVVRPGELVAVMDAGLIPYLTRCRTLDMMGLVSPEVLEQPIVIVSLPRPYLGKHRLPVRTGVVDLVMSRRPVLIQTHIGREADGFVASHPLDQLFLQEPRFRRGYVFIGDGCFVRADRWRGRGAGRPTGGSSAG